MAVRGLGLRQAPFKLIEICSPLTRELLWTPGERPEFAPEEEGAWFLSQSIPEEISVKLLTPARLPLSELKRGLSFKSFLGWVYRRLIPVLEMHCDQPVARRQEALWEAASKVELLEQSLEPVQVKRYSNRGQAAQYYNCRLGHLRFKGEGLSYFGPLLRAGELLHIGRSTVMGLGRYQIEF